MDTITVGVIIDANKRDIPKTDYKTIVLDIGPYNPVEGVEYHSAPGLTIIEGLNLIQAFATDWMLLLAPGEVFKGGSQIFSRVRKANKKYGTEVFLILVNSDKPTYEPRITKGQGIQFNKGIPQMLKPYAFIAEDLTIEGVK